jgi:hypothetical protein
VRGERLMRILFWFYFAMIVTGLTIAFVLGALGQ